MTGGLENTLDRACEGNLGDHSVYWVQRHNGRGQPPSRYGTVVQGVVDALLK